MQFVMSDLNRTFRPNKFRSKIMNRIEDKKWDLEAGARWQERGQFYSLTLSFTLLALSVQTAAISDDKIIAILESIGVLSLVASGVAGLWRLLAAPGLYKIQVHLHSLHENIDDAQKIKEKGESLIYSPMLEKSFKVDEYIDEHDKGVKHFVNEKKKLERRLSFYMGIHKFGLLFGIFVLMTSRVFVPAIKVLCS